MLVKKYRLITKDDRVFPQLFDNVKDAIASAGTAGIKKLEEVNFDDEESEGVVDPKTYVIISRENNAEVINSDKTGYAVSVNRPVLTRVFQNMPVLEVGEDMVLESKLSVIGRYDKRLHKAWDGSGKDWGWVLYHPKGKMLTIEEAKAKYGDFDSHLGKDGSVTYAMRAKL